MEFIALIHAKTNWALVEPDIYDFFFYNDSSEMIIWYLIEFDPFYDTWDFLYLLLS